MQVQTYTAKNVELQNIHAGANDRTRFDSTKLEELASDMRANGLTQPITVRPLPSLFADKTYEIVAGERRSRAARLLGWDTIPAFVVPMGDEAASIAMFGENESRADLDPIDRARAYQKRMEQFGWDVATCALKLSKSQSEISRTIRLLELRDDLQEMVRTGQLKTGYATILVASELDKNFQLIAARALISRSAPTPQWFANYCGELAKKQNQASLLGGAIMNDLLKKEMELAEADEKADPPHPFKDTPPTVEGDALTVAQAHYKFWTDAAVAWEREGRSYFQRECEAAANAMHYLIEALTQSR